MSDAKRAPCESRPLLCPVVSEIGAADFDAFKPLSYRDICGTCFSERPFRQVE